MSVFVLVYVVAGYPLLLRLLVAVRGPRQVRQADITPTVSFVISAYNEADVIRAKLENALALDYPADRREIVVISDCSDDGTDDIVREFAGRGVRLIRQSERRGKTAGLNHALPLLTGDIVVFSDANAMYEPDALRKLVRNFADAEVGYVTGEARYLLERPGRGRRRRARVLGLRDGAQAPRDRRSAPWSVATAPSTRSAARCGATLPEDAINDFLNPLQIVEAGWRGVYEPEAVCYEETSGRLQVGVPAARPHREPQLARGLPGARRAQPVPRRPLQLVPHLAQGAALEHGPLRVGGRGRGADAARRIDHVVAGRRVGGGRHVGGRARRAARSVAVARCRWPPTSAVINAASLVGVAKGTLRPRVGSLVHAARAGGRRRDGVRWCRSGPIFLIGGTLARRGCSRWPARPSASARRRVAFWASLGALAYVYALYPLLLSLLRLVARRPIKIGDFEPQRVPLHRGQRRGRASSPPSSTTRSRSTTPPTSSRSWWRRTGRWTAPTRSSSATPRASGSSRCRRAGARLPRSTTGWKRVSSEIVVFSDANTFLQRDAIRALVRNFASDEVGCVSRRRHPGRRPGAARQVGRPVLPLRALDPARRVRHRLDDRRRRRAVRDPPAALRAARRGHDPRRHGHPDGHHPRRAAASCSSRRARAGAGRRNRRMEEFSRKTRVVAGAMQFLARQRQLGAALVAAGHPVAHLAQGAALDVAGLRARPRSSRR